MRPIHDLGMALLLFLTALSFGCRAHPATLAIMLIGDLVDDADVAKRQSNLIGKKAAAADSIFGSRLETLVDTKRSTREIVIFPVKGDLLAQSRYIVEVSDNRITAVTKAKHNIDGVEDMVKAKLFELELAGKTPDECAQKKDLGPPIFTFRGQESGNLVQVYDVRNWTNTRGARYCVVRFDDGNRCDQVKLLGVGASTKKDPLRG